MQKVQHQKARFKASKRLTSSKLAAVKKENSATNSAKPAQKVEKPKTFLRLSRLAYNLQSLSRCRNTCRIVFTDPQGRKIPAVVESATDIDRLSSHNGRVKISGVASTHGNSTVLVVDSVELLNTQIQLPNNPVISPKIEVPSLKNRPPAPRLKRKADSLPKAPQKPRKQTDESERVITLEDSLSDYFG